MFDFPILKRLLHVAELNDEKPRGDLNIPKPDESVFFIEPNSRVVVNARGHEKLAWPWWELYDEVEQSPGYALAKVFGMHHHAVDIERFLFTSK